MRRDRFHFKGQPYRDEDRNERGGMPWERGPGRWFGPHRGRPGGPSFGRPPFGGPPFGDGLFDEDGGPRRRQRRGDIKFAILDVLAEQPRHGYEIIKELEQRFGGFYRPSPGSVYPTLQLLEDEGHIVGEAVEGKRVYTITDSGRALLNERRERQEADHGPRGRHGSGGPQPTPELHQLRERTGSLMGSVMEIARHGTPEQIQAALALLDNTRRELYRILAGEENKA